MKSMNRKKKFLITSVLILICGGGFYWMDRMNSNRASQNDALFLHQSQKQTENSVKRKPDSKSVLFTNQSSNLKKVLTQIGKGIEHQTDPKGRLIAMNGKLGPLRASNRRDFNSLDRGSITKRANQVINELSPFLGLNQKNPLTISQISPGKVTAQVYFEQKVEDLVITPRGKLNLRFGSTGEVIGMESTYVANVDVQNQFELSQDKAANFALQSAQLANQKIKSDSQVQMNRKVVWVADYRSSSPVGRKAYEFGVSGRRIVIDGQTGEVLSNKNMRHY